jgi:hypothetical protein
MKEGWRVSFYAQYPYRLNFFFVHPKLKCIAKCERKCAKKEGHPIGMALRQG